MKRNFFSGLFKDRNAPSADKAVQSRPDPDGSAAPDGAGETGPEEADAAPGASDARAPAGAAGDAQTPEASGAVARASASAPAKAQGFLARLRSGLTRSSGRLSEGVATIFLKRRLDKQTLEDLEDLLIGADLGVKTAAAVVSSLSRDKFDKEITDQEVRAALAGVVEGVLQPVERPLTIDAARRPHVILVVGVNGAGKTTTIGKLAARFRAEGRKVMIAAGDTFRAAAIDQLRVWGERTGAPVFAAAVGADAAGLAFDALKAARADGADVLMIDTAGRLQNRRELMDELAKMVRVLRKLDPDAPHDVLLVLDATVGQNAIIQAEAFRDIAGVTGMVMTKLDGTAKGGVLVALAERFALPVHFIGIGEGVDDLQPFNAQSFAAALAGGADAEGA